MLRAVDIKQVLLQTNSMERVQQTQQQHPEMQQRYLDIQLTEERKLLQETVDNTEDTEETRIRKKKERQDQRRAARSRQEKGRKKMPEPEDDGDGAQGTHIDIRV
jgi:hypothetical protein